MEDQRMLTITVPEVELWDDGKEEFSTLPSFQLHLEHSLVSLSKWEEKFEKAFLSTTDQKTPEEMLWYIFFMEISPGVPFEKLSRLSVENLDEINKYIESKRTATTFREDSTKKGPAEKVTAELIYYWMYSFNIPSHWEHKHLNQLFTLIRVFSVKNGKPKKQSRAEIAQWQREENARRREAHGTTG
jgi:hypothetical protein